MPNESSTHEECNKDVCHDIEHRQMALDVGKGQNLLST